MKILNIKWEKLWVLIKEFFGIRMGGGGIAQWEWRSGGEVGEDEQPPIDEQQTEGGVESEWGREGGTKIDHRSLRGGVSSTPFLLPASRHFRTDARKKRNKKEKAQGPTKVLNKKCCVDLKKQKISSKPVSFYVFGS